MKLFKAHIKKVTEATTRALEETGFDGLWIYSGHPEHHFLDDMGSPHVINPHFRWWVPVANVTSSVLHYQPGQKPTVYLYQPADFWHKVIDHSEDKWARYFDVKVIGHYSDLPKFNDWHNHAWIGGPELQPLPEINTNPKALLDHLHFSRVQKTDYEIQCIQKANQIALKGHQAARDAFYAGSSEYEIHMAYLTACQHNEYQMPYGNIVALNENSSVLHYQFQNRERLPKGQLKSFLIDAGANHHGYASDITRTYSFIDDEFAEMIKMMEDKQQQLCKLVTTGQDYIDLHIKAHHYIGEVLSEFGIVKCSVSSAVEQGLSSVFFPHGLGHYLGLQVHDVNGYIVDEHGTVKPPPENHPFLRLTGCLRENVVVTIEPGLYFIPMLLKGFVGHSDINWEKVEAFIPYGGIRIEDNVVVKKEQAINLTRTN